MCPCVCNGLKPLNGEYVTVYYVIYNSLKLYHTLINEVSDEHIFARGRSYQQLW